MWRNALAGLALLVGGCGGGSGDDGDDDGVDAGACATALDAETLDALTHSYWFAPVVEVEAGGTATIALGTVGLGGGFEPVTPVCATWSIAPTEGASINAATGAIQIEAGTASGTEYVVTADVEDGRKVITANVVVYTVAAMPWRGTWRESVEYECGTGAEVAPEEVINEIRFWADGTLWVTWLPFEVYVDYWATYTFAPGPGTLAFAATGGNYVPGDIDGDGTFAFVGDDLALHDLWLGSPQGGTGPARCGHLLTR